MPFTTLIAVVAGLCLGIGILFLFAGLRRRTDRRANLLLAGFSLAYGGAVITARASYLAVTPDEYWASSRLSYVFAFVGFTFLVWFAAAYTEVVGPRWLLWTFTGLMGALGIAAAFFPDLLFGADATVETVTLPWGETLLRLQQPDTPLFTAAVLAQLVMIGYVVAADVILYRRGDHRRAAILAIGVVWFAFTIIEENLVLAGVIDFVVLADLGFLGFVLAMSIAATNTTLETEDDLRHLQANLERLVAERTADLEAAQAQLLAQAEEQATAAERSRLARDLHDVVSQTLFSINLIAASLARMWRTDPDTAARTTDELQRLTRGALAEMRALLRELRPHTIAETDLATLLSQFSEGLARRHDIPASVTTDVDGDLPPPVHVAFYRIAQEAMNNVAKHANASSFTVNLVSREQRARLTVADDGAGFDTTTVRSGAMGIGIMHERAAGIGAELSVSSHPGGGTTVEVDWEKAQERAGRR